MNHIHPGHNEYLAAVAGLGDQTISPGTTRLRDGRPHTTYAVGDRIRWLEHGQTLAGVVVEVQADGIYRCRRHVPDVGNVHHTVASEDIVPF